MKWKEFILKASFRVLLYGVRHMFRTNEYRFMTDLVEVLDVLNNVDIHFEFFCRNQIHMYN